LQPPCRRQTLRSVDHSPCTASSEANSSCWLVQALCPSSSARAKEVPAVPAKRLRKSHQLESIIDLGLHTVPIRCSAMQSEPTVLIIRTVAKSCRGDLFATSHPRPLNRASGVPNALANKALSLKPPEVQLQPTFDDR